jgi:hypothetical protein
MTLITTTWEIEVETAWADFGRDHDEDRFRARMEKLGFDDDEIKRQLTAQREFPT